MSKKSLFARMAASIAVAAQDDNLYRNYERNGRNGVSDIIPKAVERQLREFLYDLIENIKIV